MTKVMNADGRASLSSVLAAQPRAKPQPMAFPSPYEIGLQCRRLWAQMERSQNRVIALAQGAEARVATSTRLASDQTDREEALACDREYALRDLLATLTASTLADAGVQVCRALEIVVDLEASELTGQQLGDNYRALRRLLASILPVVREASEYPLEDAVDSWALDAPMREFSVLESGE